MKKTIVIYYSKKGSNRYLADKVAENLKCDIEEIRPRLNVHVLMMMRLTLGIKKIKSDLAAYDRVILCGPVWMGKFVTPLKDFVKKYGEKIKEMVFITCCGSSYKLKDEKFGHGRVFDQVKDVMGEKCSHCEAFPISLVLPDDKKEDPETVMKTRLNDNNFDREIEERFKDFIKKFYK
ncbi:MAG: flavodoxin domain-containing protein [Acidobacteriota bacterium]